MKYFIAVAAISVVAANAAPALADRLVLTPSGQPDAVFANTPMDQAASKLASACMSAGWQISSQSSNQLICEIKVGVFKAALQQALIGNSYSTTPKTFVRFSIAQLNGDSRAQAAEWTETTMPFGQVQRADYNNDDNFNFLQNFLIGAGGEFPDGTRFPGVYLGVDGKTQTGKLASGKSATYFEVGTVDSPSPGAEAGLKVGDRIVEIGGKTFKSDEDMMKRLRRTDAGIAFPVLVEREGVATTLSVMGTPRPAVGSAEWRATVSVSSQDEPQPTPTTAVATAPIEPNTTALSAPDELVKWADLYSKGLITKEEYDAKKKQLLGL